MKETHTSPYRTSAQESGATEIAYVPTNTRYHLWAVFGATCPLAIAGWGVATGSPYAGVGVVVALAVLVVFGPAVAYARRKVALSVEPDARTINVETTRLFAPRHRRSAKFEGVAPRVSISEYDADVLLIEGGDQVLTLDAISVAERAALRGRLEDNFSAWADLKKPDTAEPVEDELAETRGLVVAALHGDLNLAAGLLRAGADPDGHADAAGRGAPLYLARLRRDTAMEALLKDHGASVDEVDEAGRRALQLLAEVEGVTGLEI